MKKINIVFGTVYGSAQFVAETLALHLNETGRQCELIQQEFLATFIPPEDEILLLVCSTTGQGDLPDSIYPWVETIKSQGLYLPNLEFGVIGLGDSSYETFCGAGKQLFELFTELGAKAIDDMLAIDACETMEPEVDALKWLTNILKVRSM